MIEQISVIIMFGICSVEDFRHKKIHIIWPLCFSILGMICCLHFRHQSMIETLIAIFPGFAVLGLSFVTNGGIGKGDSLLLMTAGIFVGAAEIIQILVYAVFISSIYALFLYIVKRKNKKYEIAFVPFLFAASVINYLYEILLSTI